ncbi:MAG TPA: endonuclease III [Actinomycetaceae bacterium]|nr:endonuclease III [Actinomycetaceae bacterium]
MRESKQARKARAEEINARLAAAYPDAHCELDFGNPFELLIATVLSAQTTDVRVNSITPELFSRYPGPEALAGAPREDVEQILRPIGFFRTKTKNIIALSHQLTTEFGGTVPDTMEELVTLPGVGRKTANVVLGNAFGVPGITVDTHVGRLSRRMGLTKNADPVKVETDLGVLLPPEEWTMACHRMIFHGRRCCTARKPACERCPVAELCPRIGVP